MNRSVKIDPLRPGWVRFMRFVSLACGCVVSAIGLLSFVGWVLGANALHDDPSVFGSVPPSGRTGAAWVPAQNNTPSLRYASVTIRYVGITI